MPVKKSKLYDKLITYEDVTNTQFGIYAYVRKDTGEVLYIGKDSHIDVNRRHLDHIAPSKKNDQAVNKYIQGQGMEEVIAYKVIALCGDEEEMIIAEIAYTLIYKAIGQAKLNKIVDLTPEAAQLIEENILKDLKLNGS